MFLKHFSSLSGGHYVDPELPEHRYIKKQLNNKRIAKHVTKLLSLTFGEKVEISFASLYVLKSIGKPNGLVESVLLQLKENNTWGTVRNYLNSLGHFYKYLKAIDHPDLNSNQLAALKESQKRLHRSIWNLNRDEMERKKNSDREKILFRIHIFVFQTKRSPND